MNIFHEIAFINDSAVDYALRKEQHTVSSDFALDEMLNHDRYCKHPSG